MTRSNGYLTQDENAEPGIEWVQIGCPDLLLLCPTLAQLLKARKVTQAALSGFLAIVKSYYVAHGYVPNDYQGACNIPIPIQVIEMISEKLVRKAQWSKKGRDARTQTAKRKHDMWQAKANVHWKKNKELTRSAVARLIDRDNWKYIRQRIHKPTK